MSTRSLDALKSQVGNTHRTVDGFIVEPGKVAEFARAIHDPAPIYLDEQAANERGFEAIPAPPTFTRVSYFPHYRPDGIDESFGFDLEFDREYVLHGEQRYRYVRPLLVGDDLCGETTLEDAFERDGGSGGTMTFAVFRTDFYDTDDALVQQAWNTRIETDGPPNESRDITPSGSLDVAHAGPDAPVYEDDEQVDTGFDAGVPGPLVETGELERRNFTTYAGASGDFNPIHYDEPYATQAGHPSVFAQGMYGAGVASGMLRRWVGLTALTSFRTRFTARIFPGESLVARGVVVDSSPESDTDQETAHRVEIEFEVVTAESGKQVVDGDATAVVRQSQ